MANGAQTGSMSVDDLASAIKAKYPDYAKTNNHDLVSKVIQKYPEYQTHLSTAALEGIAAASAPKTGLNSNNPLMRSWTYLKGEGRGLGDVGLGIIKSIPGAVKMAGDFGSAIAGNPAGSYAAGQDVIDAGKGIKQLATAPFKGETYRDPEKFGQEIGTIASFAAPFAGPEATTAIGARAGELASTTAQTMKPIVTAPIRYGARLAENTANAAISPLKPVSGLMRDADEVRTIRLKVPGRNIGLGKPATEPVEAAAEEAPFRLTPEEPVREAPVQSALNFPKVAAKTPEAPAKAAPTEPWIPLSEAKPIKTPTREIAARVDQAMGVKPLEPGVPLRAQIEMPRPEARAAEAEAGEAAKKAGKLEERYPDKAARQMVHANGEKIYEAAKGDPATLKAIHDMTRVDLRQALINAGEDMGDRTVSNSKFAGAGSVSRQEAFERLLAKGYSPEEIVALGKKPMTMGPFEPRRAIVAGARRGAAAPEASEVRVADEDAVRRGLIRRARERAQKIREAHEGFLVGAR